MNNNKNLRGYNKLHRNALLLRKYKLRLYKELEYRKEYLEYLKECNAKKALKLC